MGGQLPPAGWYDDPEGQAPAGTLRYWDGQQWTEHTHRHEAQAAPAGVAGAVGVPVSFGRRVGAALLDVVVVVLANTIVGGLLGATVGLLMGPQADLEAAEQAGSALGLLVGIVLPVVYWTVLHANKRQTVGKRAVGAVVVNTETGAGISHLNAFGRYFAEFLSGLPLGLGYLWAAWDQRRQTWHDKLASTVVVAKHSQ